MIAMTLGRKEGEEREEQLDVQHKNRPPKASNRKARAQEQTTRQRAISLRREDEAVDVDYVCTAPGRSTRHAAYLRHSTHRLLSCGAVGCSVAVPVGGEHYPRRTTSGLNRQQEH